MSLAEHKLSLFRQIDELSEDVLIEIENMISKIQEKKSKKKRKAGCMKGFVTYIADDFDAPLDDFKQYME